MTGDILWPHIVSSISHQQLLQETTPFLEVLRLRHIETNERLDLQIFHDFLAFVVCLEQSLEEDQTD